MKILRLNQMKSGPQELHAAIEGLAQRTKFEDDHGKRDGKVYPRSLLGDVYAILLKQDRHDRWIHPSTILALLLEEKPDLYASFKHEAFEEAIVRRLTTLIQRKLVEKDHGVATVYRSLLKE